MGILRGQRIWSRCSVASITPWSYRKTETASQIRLAQGCSCTIISTNLGCGGSLPLRMGYPGSASSSLRFCSMRLSHTRAASSTAPPASARHENRSRTANCTIEGERLLCAASLPPSGLTPSASIPQSLENRGRFPLYISRGGAMIQSISMRPDCSRSFVPRASTLTHSSGLLTADLNPFVTTPGSTRYTTPRS